MLYPYSRSHSKNFEEQIHCLHITNKTDIELQMLTSRRFQILNVIIKTKLL